MTAEILSTSTEPNHQPKENVVLAAGDHVYAEVEGVRTEMAEVDVGVFEAAFDAGRGGEGYSVLLDRSFDDVGAIGGDTEMPRPFDITSPTPTGPISRSQQDLELTWTEGDYGGELALEGDTQGCIIPQKMDLTSIVPRYVIKAGTLRSANVDKPQTCDVTATISHEIVGVMTGGFVNEQSSIVARQSRSMTFSSAP